MAFGIPKMFTQEKGVAPATQVTSQMIAVENAMRQKIFPFPMQVAHMGNAGVNSVAAFDGAHAPANQFWNAVTPRLG